MAGGSEAQGRGLRSAGGSAGADVNTLYVRHARRVRAFCLRRLGDEDEAADAVQDTFLRAWLALRGGARVRHPQAWLLAIAGNVCVSRFRARGARVTTAPLSAAAAEPGTPDAAEEVTGLKDALRELPHRQRVALFRRELEGYSYDEIAEELGVSRASVAALLHRARKAAVENLRKTGHGVASLVPVPALLRGFLECGGTSVAATGTAVMGVAVVQLGSPPPALHAGPTEHPDTGVATTAAVPPADRTVLVSVRAVRETAPAPSVAIALERELPTTTATSWHTPEPEAPPTASSPQPDAPTGSPPEPDVSTGGPPADVGDAPVDPAGETDEVRGAGAQPEAGHGHSSSAPGRSGEGPAQRPWGPSGTMPPADANRSAPGTATPPTPEPPPHASGDGASEAGPQAGAQHGNGPADPGDGSPGLTDPGGGSHGPADGYEREHGHGSPPSPDENGGKQSQEGGR